MLYNTPRMPSNGQKISASWGRSLIDSIRAGLPVAAPGMLLKRGMYGTSMTPMVEAKSGGVTLGGTTPLTPFKLRWFAKPTELNPDAGEWQIYLPLGCATIRSRFGSKYAQSIPYVALNDDATDAAGDAIYGWFKIADPSDGDATRTEKDGVVTLTWSVYVHFCPWPRMEATTKAAVWKPYLTNITMMFGRVSLTKAEDVDVSEEEQVILWIRHPDENFDIDVVGLDELEQNDDDNSYISIYTMSNDVVTADNRSRVTAVPWYNY